MFLSTDRNLLESSSEVHARISRFAVAYPEDSFDTIVFSVTAHRVTRAVRLAHNSVAYPTNVTTRLLYGAKAIIMAFWLPRPDVVSAQDPFETGLVAWCIARLRGALFAVEVHTDIFSPDFARHSLLNRIRVMLARFVLTRADGGYVVSGKLEKEIRARYGIKKPFEVLPIFVAIDKFQNLPRQPIPGNLLWIGRLTPEKDPLTAVDALAAARRNGHDVRLTMLGTGPLGLQVRAHAKACGVDRYLTLPGWRNPQEYLPETELTLVTSKYEGFGMAMVESLAAGVPVLAPDVGVARAAGAVIASGDYVSALGEWLVGPREQGRLALSLYANEHEYREHVHGFYQKLVDGKGRGTLSP